jgi:hypothetical protein
LNARTQSSPLARIAQRIRTHDWFGAAIEVAIVVLGIFLGFQVTQWNEARQNRAREVSLMLNVARDLREDVKDMDETIRVAESRMASLDHLLRLAGNWNPPREFPSSRFTIKVEQIPPFDPTSGYTVGMETFIFSFYDGNRFAYEALVNAGPTVVSDRDRLREIARYYASADLLVASERALSEHRIRAIDTMQAEGFSAVGSASFDQVAAAVRNTPRLRAALENQWYYANRQIFLTRSLRSDAARLAGKIEREYRRQA